MRTLLMLLICLEISSVLTAQDKIALVPYVNGLSVPVALAHVGDRMFVVEKAGYIRVVENGEVLSDPFLDIDARVNSVANERGLLGLAFHPAYNENGYFYVNYSNSSGNTTVSRFSRDVNNPDLADPNSELILFTASQPFSNHNGGNLVFGPDGYLYIGLGDGGSGGDPGNRAQNTGLILGKMLRIDVDNGSPYGIPADNPFVAVDTILPEIWAYGLRNPWRYSFDRLTGDLWIADVGQDGWEEIDYQPASSTGGENYGWRCKEGLANFNTSGCPSSDALVSPVYAYAHTSASCSGSVTGGYVYRGPSYPYFYGKYIFVDYCTGIFRSLYLDSEGESHVEQLANLDNGIFTCFGEDATGELFVAASNGIIYRIESLVTSTSEINLGDQIIWPNPTSTEFYTENDGQSHKYYVFDAFGKEVLSGVIDAGESVACNTLNSGLYVVQLIDQDNTHKTAKLVVLR